MSRFPPFWRRLEVQLVLWVILPLLTILFAVVGVGIRNHEQSMRTLVQERSASLADLLAGNVAALLERYTGRFHLVAPRASPENLEALREEIAEAGLPAEEIVLAVEDRHGQIVASVPNPFPFSVLPTSTSSVSVAPLQGSDYLLWRIPRSDGWLIVGLPVTRLPLGTLIATEYRNPAGHVALVDGYGHLIAATARALPPPFEPWDHVRVMVDTAGAVFFHRTPQGELVIAYARVPGTDWVLLLQESWPALIEPLPQLSRLLPVIVTATLAVSLLALVFGITSISRPLRRLADAAERIGKGEFTAAGRPVGGVAEIEEVRRALDRMAGQVREYQEALRHYLHRLTNLQEEERARLAREMHDDTVQALIAIHQQVQLALRALRRDPALAAARLEALRTATLETLENLRRILRALRPLYLEEVGLVAALENLAQEYGAQFRVVGTPQRLSPEVELALFRIAQEALTNAQRHAHATWVQVTLTFDQGAVRLTVEDDGVGFAVPASLSRLIQTGHLGLAGMYERAYSIGATLRISSRPGNGTRVVLVYPSPR